MLGKGINMREYFRVRQDNANHRESIGEFASYADAFKYAKMLGEFYDGPGWSKVWRVSDQRTNPRHSLTVHSDELSHADLDKLVFSLGCGHMTEAQWERAGYEFENNPASHVRVIFTRYSVEWSEPINGFTPFTVRPR